MATQNFTCTAGTAKSENLTAADAAANDDVFCVIYEAGAAQITKRTSHYGGSSAEIEVDAGVKYILKLTAAETAYLATGATYTFKRISGGTVTELYSGTITVSGATADVTIENTVAYVYSLRKELAANGNIVEASDNLEAGKQILYVKVENPTNSDIEITVTDLDGLGPTTLVNAETVTHVQTKFFAVTPYAMLPDSARTIAVAFDEAPDAAIPVTLFYV